MCLCPHRCRLDPDEAGHCRERLNREGKLTLPLIYLMELGHDGHRGTVETVVTEGEFRSVTRDDILNLVVDNGTLDFGFVAVENAIEGSVNITMDTLSFDVEVLIQREVVLPVDMSLMVLPGTELSAVKQVASFPHAYAQCRTWLRAQA